MKKLLRCIAVTAALVCAAAFFAACGQTTVPDGEKPSGTPPGTDEYYVTELEVQTPPDKTEYFVGEEFDYTGMVLYAEWNDGETEKIGAYECDEIRPSGPLTASDTTITFVYYGAETTFDITVSEQTINSLDVDSSAVEKRVVAGQNVNLTSIVVTASYGDGETMPVTQYKLTENGEEIETPSRYVVTEGTHTITVSYLNLTAQFEVVGFSGVKYDFGADSIKSDVTETTAGMPLFVEPGRLVVAEEHLRLDLVLIADHRLVKLPALLCQLRPAERLAQVAVSPFLKPGLRLLRQRGAENFRLAPRLRQ